jgi:hypothetical protein
VTTKRRKPKRRKPKRATQPPTAPVEYVLVIEDDAGRQLARALQKDSRAPIAGEEVPLQDRAAKETPHLAGMYLVHRVTHLPPPGAAVTIERYTLPWCHARRVGGDSPALAAGQPPQGQTRGVGALEPLDTDLDQTTAGELSQKSRDIATDLGDIAEEVASAIHGGTAGNLGLDLVKRLDDASRRAKQVSLSALFRSRIRRDSE